MDQSIPERPQPTRVSTRIFFVMDGSTERQGSVLGPLLFVLYINDLPDGLVSEVFMFADDTKVYREIKDDTDRETLQSDIDALQEWSNRWLLRFHPHKCKVMTVTRQTEVIYHE